MRALLNWPGIGDRLLSLTGAVGPLFKGTGLWLSAVVTPAKESLYPDLVIILGFSEVPLLLAVAAGLMGWLYRRDLRRREDHAPSPAEPSLGATEPLRDGSQLLLIPTKVSAAPGSAADQVLKEAHDVTARVRFAYLVAALAYATLLTVFFVQAAALGKHTGALIMSYLSLAPQIVAVTWFMRMTLRQRMSVFLSYMLTGSLLVILIAVARSKGISEVVRPLFYPPNGLATFYQTPVGIFVTCPLVGLCFLLARRMQPFLTLLVASLLYIEAVAAVLYSIVPDPAREISTAATERPWLIPFGLANVVLGVILAGKLLKLLPRHRLVFGLAALALAGIAFVGIRIPLQGARSVLVILSGTAGSVLGVLFVWAAFKFFVWIQEQGSWLTPEILGAHFCWLYLTLYLLVCAFFLRGSLFSGSGWLFLGCVAALVVHLAVFHTLVWRIRSRSPSPAPKRLLLLRTFGRADEPEDLLDTLDDTWRRIGAVDLLAGSDVASRTLRSSMLEAFLLRRSTDQFLKTDEEVDRRLLKLRSEVEGDARYPVNGVYCYGNAWQRAFIRLLQDADAVLMDLRGFTAKNTGCAWELDHLVKRTPLRRILLLIDGNTDLLALTKAAQEAWAHLPLDSPNANDQEPEIKFLIYDPRREADGHRLFSLLLEAAEESVAA